ncbi:Aste57867_20822 [Aphanomyces stellatus]|uniref:Aste57867_20822 protein n=1 Tax=Aphanomyces stellatus TaxID=120398 RepID=A0A485LGJ1_9STRA|nr:hypothetical protein As57867_020754 [Aphanomyces stellatus]VFT97501.1 Aste57867_20822 [Aphanomyces stellatus]
MRVMNKVLVPFLLAMHVTASPNLKQRGAVDGTIQPTSSPLTTLPPLASVLSSPLKVDANTCDLRVWTTASSDSPDASCTANCNQNIPGDPHGVVGHSCGRQGCRYQKTIEGGGKPCGNSCLMPISCTFKAPIVACNADTLTLSCAMNGPKSCSYIRSDIDYQGFDIGTTQQPSADKCCGDCLANPACKLYVWYQGTCYLKNAAGAQIDSPGRQASFVSWSSPTSPPSPVTTPPLPSSCTSMEDNTDYFGNDLTSVPRTSADQCCDVCSSTSGCKLFVWYGGVCYLKSAQGVVSTKLGAQAGFISTIPSPACGSLEDNTDYPGQDLSNQAANSVGDCCNACQNYAQCNAFAFSQETNSCYLKSSRASAVTKAGIQSSRVYKCSAVESGVNYLGNDLSSAFSETVEDCCTLCRNYDGCKAFSYVYKTCYLKSAKTDTNAHKFAVSATVLV